MATPAKKKPPVPVKKPLPKPVSKIAPKPVAKSSPATGSTAASAPKSVPAKVPAKPIAAPARPAMPVRPVTSATASKPKPADKIVGMGHNGGPISVSRTKLKTFVDKIENIEEEIAGQRADVKDIYGEAKAEGLDVKTIRKLVTMRRRDKEALKAEKELLDIYLEALDPELAEVLS